MAETKARLAQCFVTVFPELTPENAHTASIEKMESWDSIAAITLVNVVEEEFGIQMDFEALERLTSFDRVLEHLHEAHSLPE